jgi:hypothetical protein
MKLFNLPKLGFDKTYFKNLRNWYHPYVGIAIGYLISLVIFCNRNNFPLSLEYWNNYLYPIVGLILSMFIAFYGEKKQDEITSRSVSDMRDVYFTGLGGLFGGYITMLYANWYLAIALTISSIALIIFKHKK